MKQEKLKKLEEDGKAPIPDYVVRMKEERTELEERFDKLVKFLKSDKAKELPFVRFELMNKQANAMMEYLRVLTMRLELEIDERIADWQPKEEA